MNIEVCHRLPVRRNPTNASKRVIVKFVNQKHAESIMSKKFTLSSMDFYRLNVNNKVYVNPSLYPILIIVIYGEGVKIYNPGR